MGRRPSQSNPVLEHWLDQKFCRLWIEKQSNGGDLWRQRLIAPVVMRMCSAVAGPAMDVFEFSAFSALRSESPVSKLSGVRIVDLGSGEGWLGRLVGDAGADYFGVDFSSHLVAAAARRRLHVSGFNLEQCQKDDLPWDALGGTPSPKTLISLILVLEHLSDAAVEGLLGRLADKLAKLAFDVPVMIVTLNFGLYGRGLTERDGDGPWPKREVVIECMEKVVPAYVRPREWYERRFRDAGFFVRSCEPLHFGKPKKSDTDDRPVGHRGLARLPTFWFWRLSARRQLVENTAALRRQLQEVLAGAPQTILNAFSSDGDDDKVRFYRLAAGQHVVHAENIGGELMVVVEGQVDVVDSTVLRDDQLSFGRGTLLGELEAGTTGDESHYCADALASAEGSVIAVLAKSQVDRLLQAHDGELGTVLYRNLRDKLRLALWRRHTSEPPGQWSKFPGNIPSRLSNNSPPVPYDVWRAARVLLWRAAIERRSRNWRGLDDVAFLNLTRTKSQFPGTSASGIGRAFYLFREARLVDLYFGRDLLSKDDDSSVKEAINQGWIDVVTAATKSFLVPFELPNLHGQSGVLEFCQKELGDMKGKTDLSKRDAEHVPVRPLDVKRIPWPTKRLDDLFAELKTRLRDDAASHAAFDAWYRFVMRAEFFWKAPNEVEAFFILRDRPALHRLARWGEVAPFYERINHLLGDWDGNRQHREFGQNDLQSKLHYIARVESFFESDLQQGASRQLLYSDEMESWNVQARHSAAEPGS